MLKSTGDDCLDDDICNHGDMDIAIVDGDYITNFPEMFTGETCLSRFGDEITVMKVPSDDETKKLIEDLKSLISGTEEKS